MRLAREPQMRRNERRKGVPGTRFGLSHLGEQRVILADIQQKVGPYIARFHIASQRCLSWWGETASKWQPRGGQ